MPDQTLIVNALEGVDHVVGTRGDGYAWIYSPMGRKFTVNMNKLPGTKVKAWWYNPRTGDVTDAGEFDTRGEHEFTCPAEGFGADWVLGLDDDSRDFPKPQFKARISAAAPSTRGRTPRRTAPAK